MRCQELEDRLNALLDARREIQADPDMADHLADCAACALKVSAYQRLLEGTAAIEIPEPSEEFAQRVLEACPSPRRASWQGMSLAALMLATAATILIAILVGQPGSTPETPDNEISVWQENALAPDVVYVACLNTGEAVVAIPGTVRKVASDTQLAGRIRPVTGPVEAAWEAFRRVLPSSTSSADRADQETSMLLASVHHLA